MDYLSIFLIAVLSYAVLVALTYLSFKVALENSKIKKAEESESAEPEKTLKKNKK